MYHLGLIRGTGRTEYWGNNHKTSTVVLQARQSIDYLSCDLWEYIGEYDVTKKSIKDNKQAFLLWINNRFNTKFKTIIID